ncbi:nitroreductase family deazaflavin-dependent oxidoreductase [Mycolicibacterium tokaiense]|uniref:Deazaflavin-dependent nitroreductase family protein n=1 Tax=Mycolicibacterium tokaiense TaxID=39695 RepID=A0A378TK78_9MYCO|nr:nitroreductase family deazaflavin-dependent oxidoreductase [Mycolicibacterium tokaiense]BBY85532.1 nitroreductase [Mycolicibacterium tokaiense]STZ59956.1 deazaflavin-dependent nitroreductase family protein [Mycolicibacterium tokaiense]
MSTVDDLHGDPHVQRYLDTGGAEGFHWNGTEILILFTTGRKSQAQRRHALIFREWNGSYLVVASKGGAEAPPEWFLNLESDPHAEVQIKDRRFPVTARVAGDDEKPDMWKAMTEVWPDYDDYQAKSSRTIPVVVLDPS